MLCFEKEKVAIGLVCHCHHLYLQRSIIIDQALAVPACNLSGVFESLF